MKKAEEIKVTDAVVETGKKKQKASASYTLKSFKENNRKLEELGLITKETKEHLDQLQKKAVEKWIETL